MSHLSHRDIVALALPESHPKHKSNDCQAKDFQGLRRNPYFRNPDDLLFADTADEARLPRQELLKRQRSRRRRPAGRRPAQSRSRPKAQPRCLAVPPQRLLDQLSSYNTDDVIQRALKQVPDLCPENLSTGMWRQFQNRLEELSQRTRRRLARRNPLSQCIACGMRRNPGESTATLARRALTKMRQARAKAGFDVFRRNSWRRRNPAAPWGGSAWATHMSSPPEALDGPATSLNTSMTEHFLGPM